MQGHKLSEWKVFLRRALPYLVLAAVSIAVYAPSLAFKFTSLDDQALIAERLPVLQSSDIISRAFAEPFFGKGEGPSYYRPLTTLSFALDARTGNGVVWPFHLTNLLLHLLAVLLIFSFLRIFGAGKPVAFGGALLFAVHPLAVQVVAWIPGRGDSLLALGALASMIAFVKFLRTENGSWLVLHVLAFLLSLGAKEAAVVLVPLYIAARFMQNKEIQKNFLRDVLLGLIWLGGLIIWFVLRWRALGVLTGSALANPFTAFVANIEGAIQLLGKVFVPIGLAPLPTVADLSLGWGIAAAILVVAAVMIVGSAQRKAALFGLGWMILFILPALFASNPILVKTGDLVLENRTYVPLIGLALICVLVIERWGRYVSPKVGWALLVLIAAGLTFRTLTYAAIYKDERTLWTAAAHASPDLPLAHRNLGAILYLAGDKPGAEKESKIALELNPKEPMVRNNLGLIAFDRGDDKAAERLFREEIAIDPGFVGTYLNLARLLDRTGRAAEAQEYLARAYRLNPGLVR